MLRIKLIFSVVSVLGCLLPLDEAIAAMPEACQGKEKAYLAAGQIPLFVEDENHGIFVEMTIEAAKRAQIPISLVALPKRRAVAYFNNNRVDAVLPHLKEHTSAKGYSSSPILIKRNFAFVQKGSSPPRNVNELRGMNVGLTAQYYYSKAILNAPAKSFSRSAQTDAVNLTMVHRGRVDVAIVEEISGLEALRKSGLSGELVYDKEHPISAQEAIILFALTDCGKALKKVFSKFLLAMEADGTTRNIKARYFSRVKRDGK